MVPLFVLRLPFSAESHILNERSHQNEQRSGKIVQSNTEWTFVRYFKQLLKGPSSNCLLRRHLKKPKTRYDSSLIFPMKGQFGDTIAASRITLSQLGSGWQRWRCCNKLG